MLPFLIKRKLEPGSISVQHNTEPEVPQELEHESKLKNMLIDALIAKLLLNMDEIEGDESNVG